MKRMEDLVQEMMIHFIAPLASSFSNGKFFFLSSGVLCSLLNNSISVEQKNCTKRLHPYPFETFSNIKKQGEKCKRPNYFPTLAT